MTHYYFDPNPNQAEEDRLRCEDEMTTCPHCGAEVMRFVDCPKCLEEELMHDMAMDLGWFDDDLPI